MPRAKRVQSLETFKFFDHGSNSSVSTIAVQLTTDSLRAKKGVAVVADGGNTDDVFIGKSDVTAGSTDATDGMPINPAGPLIGAVVPVEDPSLVYVISASGTQKVYWWIV